MVDPAMLPDAGLPLADGFFLQLARARLHALNIQTAEEFEAHFGIDIYALTAFQLLYVVDPVQGERELRLNALYRSGLRKHPVAPPAPATEGRAA